MNFIVIAIVIGFGLHRFLVKLWDFYSLIIIICFVFVCEVMDKRIYLYWLFWFRVFRHEILAA
jgi:hypothetical protein